MNREWRMCIDRIGLCGCKAPKPGISSGFYGRQTFGRHTSWATSFSMHLNYGPNTVSLFFSNSVKSEPVFAARG